MGSVSSSISLRLLSTIRDINQLTNMLRMAFNSYYKLHILQFHMVVYRNTINKFYNPTARILEKEKTDVGVSNYK